MQITGSDFLEAVCNKLKNKDSKALLYDSTLIREIRGLTSQELNELTQLGKWSDEYYKNVQMQGEKHLEYNK